MTGIRGGVMGRIRHPLCIVIACLLCRLSHAFLIAFQSKIQFHFPSQNCTSRKVRAQSANGKKLRKVSQFHTRHTLSNFPLQSDCQTAVLPSCVYYPLVYYTGCASDW